VRAAHNNAHARSGQSGAGFLPSLKVAFIVEQRCASVNEGLGWRDVWAPEPTTHDCFELANQRADALRAEGFTVRVRPVVL